MKLRTTKTNKEVKQIESNLKTRMAEIEQKEKELVQTQQKLLKAIGTNDMDAINKLLNKEVDVDDDVDEPHRTPTHRIQMNELREGIYANKQRVLSVSTELE